MAAAIQRRKGFSMKRRYWVVASLVAMAAIASVVVGAATSLVALLIVLVGLAAARP